MSGKSDLKLQSFISDILQGKKSLWLSFYSFMYDILSLNLTGDRVLFLLEKKKKKEKKREICQRCIHASSSCSEGCSNTVIVSSED